MRADACAVAIAGAAGLAVTAVADMTGTTVENLGDVGAGANTYRLYLLFDDDRDQMLAVAADSDRAPMVFSSDTDLLQHCEFEDDIRCDTNEGYDLGGDSWLNVGDEMGDTVFNPNFLGGDGMRSVVEGNFFGSSDHDGYFDSNPGSEVQPDVLGRIVVAQFTLPPETTDAYYHATVYYLPGGVADGVVAEIFFFTIVDDCPGDFNDSGRVSFEDLLLLLAAWGPCDVECFEDLDGSGHVSFDDLLILLAAWGACEG